MCTREWRSLIVLGAAVAVSVLILVHGPIDIRAIEVVIALVGLSSASAILIQQVQAKAREAALRRGQLIEAVEAITEGFVLFDAEGRLIVCNSRYRAAYPLLADVLVEGASFPAILRTAAERRGDARTPEQLAAWVDERVKRHLANGKPPVVKLSDGCWYRISEHATPSGGTVKLLTDVSELKERVDA
jgi:PAS domain-containing protein